MIDRFSQAEVVASISRLTHAQLQRFLQADFVRLLRDPAGFVFRQSDSARLELLCDMTLDLELDAAALAVVVALRDQLHSARAERNALAARLRALPAAVQAQIICPPEAASRKCGV